jgi:hypothetical protein
MDAADSFEILSLYCTPHRHIQEVCRLNELQFERNIFSDNPNILFWFIALFVIRAELSATQSCSLVLIWLLAMQLDVVDGLLQLLIVSF